MIRIVVFVVVRGMTGGRTTFIPGAAATRTTMATSWGFDVQGLYKDDFLCFEF